MSTSTPNRVDVWFEFASTYSYPAIMRVEAEAQARGVPLIWRPFLLGPVFAAQGLADSPFKTNEIKGAYMWRDIERICAADDLPFQRPSRFPRGSLLSARIAFAFSDARWIGAFVRRVYTANFADDADVDQPEVIVALLDELDLDSQDIVTAATTPDTKLGLLAQTEAAIASGIFGAPTFAVGPELFWGNDRLEAALAWATGPKP